MSEAPSTSGQGPELRGSLGVAGRSPLRTVLLGLSGVLALRHIARSFAKAVLGLRQTAEVALDPEGLRIHVTGRLLGRTTRDEQTLVPLDGLASISREVRFAKSGLYLGLLALTVGTWCGLGLILDGTTGSTFSTSAVLFGLGVIAFGLGADFVTSTLSDSSRGRCRLIIQPRNGAGWTISGLEPAVVDSLLDGLQGRLNRSQNHA